MFSNADELQKIMNKGCKGSVTELTKVAERMLIKNTKAQFGPTAPKHIIERPTQVPYKRSGKFVRSISISKTLNEGDAFSNEVYFDENKMRSFAKKKDRNYLGQYMDVDGRFDYGASKTNDDDDDLESGLISWLEHGTTITNQQMAKFSREGAHFMEKTKQEIQAFIEGKVPAIIESYIDTDVVVELAGIGIRREK